MWREREREKRSNYNVGEEENKEMKGSDKENGGKPEIRQQKGVGNGVQI